jgi:hypothetical protein
VTKGGNFVNKTEKKRTKLFFFIPLFLFVTTPKQITRMFIQVLIAGASMTDLAMMSVVFSTLCYLSYVRYRRYQSVNSIIKKYPNPNIVLENHDIAMEIYSNIFRKEFPCKSIRYNT